MESSIEGTDSSSASPMTESGTWLDVSGARLTVLDAFPSGIAFAAGWLEGTSRTVASLAQETRITNAITFAIRSVTYERREENEFAERFGH
jgi:hypothetical protein